MNNQTISICFLLLAVVVHVGCASNKPWPGYPHEIILIPGERLLEGDLRYNIRIIDGDIIYPSATPIFTSAKVLGTSVDRVRPDGIGSKPAYPPYRIKVGDLLHIDIYELCTPGVDDSQIRKVAENGSLRLSIVGLIENVEGKSCGELERLIADKLQADDRLEDATVRVIVLQGDRTYKIIAPTAYIGSGNPNIKQMGNSSTRLLEAIDEFGEIPRKSYRHIYIIRMLHEAE